MRTTVVFLAIALQLALTTATPVSRRSVVLPGQLTVRPQAAGQCQHYEHRYCNLFGYNHAFFPNGRNQDATEASAEFNDYVQLIGGNGDGTSCSVYMGTLLCFYYFPFCKLDADSNAIPRPDDKPSPNLMEEMPEMVLPCRNICVLAKEGCQRFMQFGWPSHLNCSQLPDTPFCASGEQHPYPRPSTNGPKDPEPEGSGSTVVLCDPPTDPSNGKVSLGETGTAVGSEAIYSCNDGYQLSGESRRECQSDGQLSGSEPSCEPVDCGGPSDPVNGHVDYNTTTVGSVARYSCNECYSLVGVTARRCLIDGTWSGHEPVCEDPVCPRCNIRTRCTSNTFKRNHYTFVAWVTLRQIMENTACNRSYEMEVQRQYATGAPTMGSRIQVDTTSGFGCPLCPESGNNELPLILINQEYLIAGYYEENPVRWYLDSTDSLVSVWTGNSKYPKNMEKWVGRRST